MSLFAYFEYAYILLLTKIFKDFSFVKTEALLPTFARNYVSRSTSSVRRENL